MWLMAYRYAKLHKDSIGIDNNEQNCPGDIDKSSGQYTMVMRVQGSMVLSLRLRPGHRWDLNQLYSCPFRPHPPSYQMTLDIRRNSVCT